MEREAFVHKTFNPTTYGPKNHFKKKVKLTKEQMLYFLRYKEKQFQAINTPFCNFAQSLNTIQNYQNILRFCVGNHMPFKIKVEMTLYHGCEKLVEQCEIEEVYFSNNVHFDKWINFGNLRYCQLPIKTRLSINLYLVFT